MYHELLMALLGYTGDLFQFDGRFIKISKDLQVPLFHPSELHIVDELLEVASYYKRLESFLDSQFEFDIETSINQAKEQCTDGKSSRSNKSSRLFGLYVSSFCKGIRDIIELYQKEIVDLEQELLDNPYMTVTEIRAKTEQFRAVFQALDSMVLKVQAQSRSSVLIVEFVKTEYDLNVHLQHILKRLTPWVNQIMYNQIINWIVFGSLHDPNGEFFIKQQQMKDIKSNSSMNVSKLDSSTSTGNKSSHSALKHASRGSKDSNHEKFYVDYAAVPSHFPMSVTDRIFYIGNSIGILSNSEKTRSSIILKQQHFYDKMKKLPLDTFRIEELSTVLGEIAVEVGKDLHHLVVTETDLPKHLGIIKDFYLTGRGELFHDFLLNLKSMTMTKSSVLTDVRRAFTLAATRVQVQDDILQRIHIQLPVVDNSTTPNLNFIMNSMSLGMEDEWPLHILFTPESLLKYNELFRFLLQVRLLQIELNRIWLNTRHVFRFPVPQGPAELRNVMSYFIDHLQHYLHEDVLENQYVILTSAVDKSENFDQILLAHAQFQSSILAQSFRSSKQLRHFLDEILKVCYNYVRFMSNHIQLCEEKDIPINEGISKEVLDYSMDFRRHMDLLLNLLKNLALTQSGQYLGQFLLRLDFNSYFSSIISGFNV